MIKAEGGCKAGHGYLEEIMSFIAPNTIQLDRTVTKGFGNLKKLPAFLSCHSLPQYMSDKLEKMQLKKCNIPTTIDNQTFPCPKIFLCDDESKESRDTATWRSCSISG